MRALTKQLPLIAIVAVIAMNFGAFKNSSFFKIRENLEISLTSSMELPSVAEAVALEFTASGTLPLTDFSAFLNENMMERDAGQTRETWKDLWGTPYRLSLGTKEQGIYIWSAGPDQEWRSDDDLRHYRTLIGLGRDEQVFTPVHLQQWQWLAKTYRDEAGSEMEVADGTEETESEAKKEKEPEIDETEARVFEFEKVRVARGSAAAKLAMAKRFVTGDDFVEKDLTRARQLLEEAVEELPTKSQKSRAELLLDEVLSQLKKEP